MEAYEAGLLCYTPLFRYVHHHAEECLSLAGVVEAAYLIDEMDVEIIADGVHLPKSLLQFVYKFKGPDRTDFAPIPCVVPECPTVNRYWAVSKRSEGHH